jgi:hypothetical protein
MLRDVTSIKEVDGSTSIREVVVPPGDEHELRVRVKADDTVLLVLLFSLCYTLLYSLESIFSKFEVAFPQIEYTFSTEQKGVLSTIVFRPDDQAGDRLVGETQILSPQV